MSRILSAAFQNLARSLELRPPGWHDKFKMSGCHAGRSVLPIVWALLSADSEPDQVTCVRFGELFMASEEFWLDWAVTRSGRFFVARQKVDADQASAGPS